MHFYPTLFIAQYFMFPIYIKFRSCKITVIISSRNSLEQESVLKCLLCAFKILKHITIH